MGAFHLYLLVGVVFSDNFIFNFGDSRVDKELGSPIHDLSLPDSFKNWAVNQKLCELKCFFDDIKDNTKSYLAQLVRS